MRKNRRVIVTGTSGFIGNRVAKYFVDHGYEVLGWNRTLCEGVIRNIIVDFQDDKAIKHELEAFRPDIIIHCAGTADVGMSVNNPEIDYYSNVTITHNLLFALHKTGLENTRLVFLSSAAVYGNPRMLPVCEDTPIRPLSPYALHKAMCEQICNYFTSNYNMNIIIARIFSAYGIGLKKQIFWDMYKKYIDTGQLDMYGTGKESRDFIHVDDVAQAIYLITICDTDERIFNIANGEEISIELAVSYAADSMDIDRSKISFNGMVREGDPLNWRGSIEKLCRLGYKKTINLEDGIKEYYRWVKSEENICG